MRKHLSFVDLRKILFLPAHVHAEAYLLALRPC